MPARRLRSGFEVRNACAGEPAGSGSIYAVSGLLLQATSISKNYAGVHALKDVSFGLRAGEVHALVGENGAGKSTLIKIITGAVSPDAGSLTVGGRVAQRMDPHTSRALGIAAIYQQPALFPDLTVAENIALSSERGSIWRRVDWRARRRSAAQLLDRVGASIHPDRIVGTLSMPEQQMVEIAKAIGADARILIMDEPTASLTAREVDRLFAVIHLLRGQDVGIIYISHRLDEISAIADRITVLRDGEAVATTASTGVDRAGLIRLMVGRELSSVFPKRRVGLGSVALEVRHLSHRASGIRDISFTVRRGEIFGLAGLVGSGRTELAEILFGLRPADEGEVLVQGHPAHVSSPARAIDLGIGYVPEDRRQHGVILEMSVAANASLANLRSVVRHGLIDRAAEHAAAASYVQRLRIKTASVSTEVGSLSGGNQQKVALARWLAINPSVLILDEPTQGVDVGSKAEIHELMGMLAEQGLAIVMISSEMPEILGMSDRIGVMHGGTIRGVLSRDEANQNAILSIALGDAASATPH
jgi:rhamnose transport system ATP-binding protein